MSIPEDQTATSLRSAVAPRATGATARYARKKQAIIAAASEILNRDGIKGMTLANVAARVGLITTSVTYYFKKKEDLAVACLLEGIERFEALFDEALREPTAPARLAKVLDLWLELQRRIALREAPALPAFNDIRALQKPQRTIIVDAYFRYAAKVRSLFSGPGLEWLDERAAAARAQVLLEQMYWAVAWLPRYDLEDYGRIRDRMLDIFMHGLVMPGRQWQPQPLALDQVLDTSPESSAREAFLIAATRLINERGYRGASVEKISARLNVTKGSFYHHNEAKDDVVVECFNRTYETMRRIQRAVMSQPGDCWSKLSNASATLIDYQLSEQGPLLRTSALSALPPQLRGDVVRASDRASDRFAAIISDGIAEGSIRPVDPFLAAQMLTITINAVADIRWWVPDVKREEAAELYAKP
ncbi:MAG TPA: TetR/AcrR family transcriptional regulator, partial [Steroidobacteraceae bacterium]